MSEVSISIDELKRLKKQAGEKFDEIKDKLITPEDKARIVDTGKDTLEYLGDVATFGAKSLLPNPEGGWMRYFPAAETTLKIGLFETLILYMLTIFLGYDNPAIAQWGLPAWNSLTIPALTACMVFIYTLHMYPPEEHKSEGISGWLALILVIFVLVLWGAMITYVPIRGLAQRVNCGGTVYNTSYNYTATDTNNATNPFTWNLSPELCVQDALHSTETRFTLLLCVTGAEYICMLIMVIGLAQYVAHIEVVRVALQKADIVLDVARDLKVNGIQPNSKKMQSKVDMKYPGHPHKDIISDKSAASLMNHLKKTDKDIIPKVRAKMVHRHGADHRHVKAFDDEMTKAGI